MYNFQFGTEDLGRRCAKKSPGRKAGAFARAEPRGDMSLRDEMDTRSPLGPAGKRRNDGAV